jgi:hypothetical protein
MDFLQNLVCSSSTGLLGSCLVRGGSILAGLRMGLFLCAYVLNHLERREKRMHIHAIYAFLVEIILILPCMQTHPENVTCQISLICRCHTGIVSWAVVPAGQLCNVGVELLYTLYKLTYANLLGLLEHVGKVVLLLLARVVGKHSKEVEHHAVIK